MIFNLGSVWSWEVRSWWFSSLATDIAGKVMCPSGPGLVLCRQTGWVLCSLAWVTQSHYLILLLPFLPLRTTVLQGCLRGWDERTNVKCSIRDGYPIRESFRWTSKTYVFDNGLSFLSFVKGLTSLLKNGCYTYLVNQSSFIFFSSLSFSPWNPSVHDEAREKMLTQKVSA